MQTAEERLLANGAETPITGLVNQLQRRCAAEQDVMLRQRPEVTALNESHCWRGYDRADQQVCARIPARGHRLPAQLVRPTRMKRPLANMTITTSHDRFGNRIRSEQEPLPDPVSMIAVFQSSMKQRLKSCSGKECRYNEQQRSIAAEAGCGPTACVLHMHVSATTKGLPRRQGFCYQPLSAEPGPRGNWRASAAPCADAAARS